MTRFLGLDLGERRTGVAFGDDVIDIVVALDTLESKDEANLFRMIGEIVKTKRVDVLAVGLPKLLDGTEGEQASWVRTRTERLQKTLNVPVVYADERFSSYGAASKKSADSKAACDLVQVAMKQAKNHY